MVSLAFDVYETLRKQSSTNGGGQQIVLGGTNTALRQLHQVLLTAYKILLRKQANRAGLGAAGVRALGLLVSMASSNTVAAEGSNALLNMCYEANNVSLLERSGGSIYHSIFTLERC